MKNDDGDDNLPPQGNERDASTARRQGADVRRRHPRPHRTRLAQGIRRAVEPDLGGRGVHPAGWA